MTDGDGRSTSRQSARLLHLAIRDASGRSGVLRHRYSALKARISLSTSNMAKFSYVNQHAAG